MTFRSDKVTNDLIAMRFNQMPPVDQLAITEAAIALSGDINKLGVVTAKEVLYQVGRLMVVEEGRHRRWKSIGSR